VKKNDRYTRLTEILRVRSSVPVKDLARMLSVSEMTVRRDLKDLNKNGVVENVNGIFVYNPAHLGVGAGITYRLADEVEKQNKQKEAIGLFAASMVERNDFIIVDTGTTTERIIPNLPFDCDITVLCYNVNILMELRRNPGVKMLFGGGHYHPNTQMFECEESERFIRKFRAQKVFVSAAGIHPQLGVTCANDYELPTKKAILESSLQKILVSDSSKFGAVRSSYFCELNKFDDIVTDSGLSGEWRRLIASLGIKLHIVL